MSDVNKEDLLNSLIDEAKSYVITRIPQHIGYQNGCLVEFSPSVTVNNLTGLTTWIQKCIRFLGVYYPNDIAYYNFQKIKIGEMLNPDLKMLVGQLEAIKNYPSICEYKNASDSSLVNLVNNQTQTQTQTQTQSFEFTMKHLEEEFSESQIEQIAEIIKSQLPKSTKRTQLLNLLESFGVSIGANVITSFLMK
ncbi:MAG: hypothetical protein J6C44_02065 [Muribaculaceae bacterium]|nr:hypothetical protein [Muribaculaceae bacterium]